MTLVISRQIFENYSNFNFRDPSNGRRLVSWGRAEGQTWRS